MCQQLDGDVILLTLGLVSRGLLSELQDPVVELGQFIPTLLTLEQKGRKHRSESYFFKPAASQGSSTRDTLLPRDAWQSLETILVITAGGGVTISN